MTPARSLLTRCQLSGVTACCSFGKQLQETGSPAIRDISSGRSGQARGVEQLTPAPAGALKWWASEQDIKIKSPVMEALALHFPSDKPHPTSRREAVLRVPCMPLRAATKSLTRLGSAVHQPDLDYEEFAECLRAARDARVRAFQALNNNNAAAIQHRGKVFGDGFPMHPATGRPLPAVAPALPRTVKDIPQG